MEISPYTRKLYDDSIVVDMTAPGSPLGPITPDDQSTNEWIGSYEGAGCTFASCTVAADHVTNTIEACIIEIAKARKWFLSQPDRFVMVEKASDITKAKECGKLAVSLNFQGSLPYQQDLKLVELYKRLGVHHVLLTYNNKNMVGDGCHERTDSGLSTFGLSMIAEMNRVGVLVDVTHAGYRTAMEAVEASSAPVIMSHSSPSAIFEHERNVPDDQIKAVAQTGGVIGMQGVGIFQSADGMDVSPERLFAFLDYSVQLVGPEHVGFGLDYVMHIENVIKAIVEKSGNSYKKGAGYQNAVQRFSPPAIMPEITEIMLQHKYPEDAVRMILGGNWLRVISEVCG